jgi:hypothetical protein
MRLEAQARMGYYPIPDPVMRLIAHRLFAPDPSSVTAIDPCCGEGLALRTLARELDIPGENLYAVELDAARTAAARDALPGAVFPTLEDGTEADCCGFESLSCPSGVFSLVYLNPPFDDELGGGRRTEHEFFQRAVRLLRPGTGLMVLVAPIKIFDRNAEFCKSLDCYLEDTELWTFPEEHRRFREAVLVGRRRARPQSSLDPDGDFPLWADCWSRRDDWTNPVGPGPARDVLPGERPKRFVKTDFTPEELLAALNASPLRAAFRPASDVPPEPPGMSLGSGHQALLVMSGLTDGVVLRPGEVPFAVRGTVFKEKFVDHEKGEYNPETATSKTVVSESFVNRVRCVEPDGTFYTFTNGTGVKVDEDLLRGAEGGTV